MQMLLFCVLLALAQAKSINLYRFDAIQVDKNETTTNCNKPIKTIKMKVGECYPIEKIFTIKSFDSYNYVKVEEEKGSYDLIPSKVNTCGTSGDSYPLGICTAYSDIEGEEYYYSFEEVQDDSSSSGAGLPAILLLCLFFGLALF